MSDLSGTPYNLLWAGTTNVLPAISKVAQRFWKDPLATFPAWQGMQYFMSTFSGQSQLRHVENNRYGKHPWTTVKDVLAQHALDGANQH